MRRVFHVLAVCLAVSFVSGAAFSNLQPAGASDLVKSWGGADCWNCRNFPNDSTCQPGFLGNPNSGCDFLTGKSYCYKYTFMKIDTAYCKNAGSGQRGSTSCTTSDPKVCVKIQTCTDCDKANNSCGNCGEAATEEKNTKCTQSAYDCQG